LIDDMTALAAWGNFYVIVGSSAGALIGLQFVVMTLVANMPPSRADAQAGNAFSTPSVVHFGTVLLLSAAASAPWDGIGAIAVVWGLVGLSGVVYAVVVGSRMRLQTVYQPVFEDQLFHVVLPFAAYAMLAAAACVASALPRLALFLVGASALLLLFVGIHNAWDIVMYHVFVMRHEKREDDQQP
jgi:hypothetical protein